MAASDTDGQPGLSAIVLAAGKGTRMKSDLPKVCHEVGGRPMVCAVVDACLEAGCSRVVAVVGYKQELVREALASFGDAVEFAVQAEQHGTGHAVACARDAYEGVLASGAAHDAFVLAGDGPLIRPETLRTLLERHRGDGAAAALATSVIDDPSGYGRIVRNASTRTKLRRFAGSNRSRQRQFSRWAKLRCPSGMKTSAALTISSW